MRPEDDQPESEPVPMEEESESGPTKSSEAVPQQTNGKDDMDRNGDENENVTEVDKNGDGDEEALAVEKPTPVVSTVLESSVVMSPTSPRSITTTASISASGRTSKWRP